MNRNDHNPELREAPLDDSIGLLELCSSGARARPRRRRPDTCSSHIRGARRLWRSWAGR